MGIPADSPGFDTEPSRGYSRYQTITFMKTTEVCKNPGTRGPGFQVTLKSCRFLQDAFHAPIFIPCHHIH